ncbi:MAG TPA: hypothetical protein VF533_09830 [Solirubrobacteraceae bacterium]|jgi:hypothetical protein
MTITIRRRALAALAAAGLSLAGAAGAQASAEFPALAVQPNGTSHFAWVNQDNRIGERAWPAAQSNPLAATVISTGTASEVDVASNAAGDTAFVWLRQSPSAFAAHVEARRRNADGTLGPVLNLTPGYAGDAPRVAISSNGSAFAVWQRDSYVLGRRISADGVLGKQKIFSAAGYASSSPDVAMDGTGAAIVIWKRRDQKANTEVVQAIRVAGNDTVGVVKTLGPSSTAMQDPRVGIDQDGDAVLGWLEWDGQRYVPSLRVRRSVGTFSDIDRLFSGGPSAAHLQLAVNAAGDATAVWERGNATIRTIELRRRAADGTLGLLRTMSSEGTDTYPESPQVAMDADGGAYVVWLQHPGANANANRVVHGRGRTPAGTLTAIQQLSQSGEYAHQPRVGVADSGNATIAWGVITGGQPSAYRVDARRRIANGGGLTAIKTIAG